MPADNKGRLCECGRPPCAAVAKPPEAPLAQERIHRRDSSKRDRKPFRNDKTKRI